MAISEFISNIKDKVTPETEADTPEIPEADPDLLSPDPAPARRAKKPTAPKPPASKVTASVRSQVSDSLTLLLLGPATVWAMRDPCGQIALDVLDKSVARAVPIVCRNPGILRFFTEGQGWLEWVALGSVLSPLAGSVWQHHVVGHGHDQEPGEVIDDELYSTFPYYG